jgi:chromate transporter
VKTALEIFLYFLKLGATGFGGPLAIIAIMQKELIEERQWLSQEEFAQALALIKAMPGALAFQTAVFLGRRRGGYWGGTMAALGLLMPSFFMMVLLAKYYDFADAVRGFRGFFNGMQAAAIVLMVQGLRSLMLPYFSVRKFWFFFFIGGIIFFFNLVPEPLLILSAGAMGLVISQSWRSMSFFILPPVDIVPALASSRMGELMWVCFKSGTVVFGSGLAIVPLLQRDFVDHLGWLNTKQFLDALALGQITPGPVLITVTFIGFRVAGWLGATAATVAVFFPGYIHMQTWFPKMFRALSQKKWINDFLIPSLGVICGILLVTIFRLVGGWQETPIQLALIALVCAFVGTTWKIPSWALIMAGGLLNVLLSS